MHEDITNTTKYMEQLLVLKASFAQYQLSALHHTQSVGDELGIGTDLCESTKDLHKRDHTLEPGKGNRVKRLRTMSDADNCLQYLNRVLRSHTAGGLCHQQATSQNVKDR